MSGKIEIGSRVAYSVKFLRSISAYTGPLPFARGIVTGISSLSDTFALADITWDKDRDETPSRVNIANLVLESRIHLQV